MTAPETLTAGPLAIVRAARAMAYSVKIAQYAIVTPARTTATGDLVPERTHAYLDVRGWRRSDGRRFAVRWKDGKADVAYWWTTFHHTTLSHPTEEHCWTSEHRTAERIGVTDLRFLLKEFSCPVTTK